MHWTCAVCLVLALGCLISLVQYVLSQIVRPIIRITESAQPLQEGRLTLDIDYKANNELGDLSTSLHVLLRTAGEIVQRGIHLLNGACLLRRALG